MIASSYNFCSCLEVTRTEEDHVKVILTGPMIVACQWNTATNQKQQIFDGSAKRCANEGW